MSRESLYYTDGHGTPCYGGNISSMTWEAGEEGVLRGYKYSYDGLGRLQKAAYGEGEYFSGNEEGFSEAVGAYDRNGNILNLQRYGQTGASAYGLVDNLSYKLDGNRLSRVDDAATASALGDSFEFKDAVQQENEYAYDANGNLTKDLNRGIAEIQYNFLHLPEQVVFGSGDRISYVYAADGTKLRRVAVVGGVTTTTDYCGNVVYENGVPDRLLTEEGYVTLGDSKYHYYLRDHQGNNRVVVDASGAVEEVNHYYPFGGVFAASGAVQPYKYNGKELELPAQWHDYGARRYDAALGRFTTVDPLAEKYFSWSPYVYCGNNPIRFIDPNGKDWKDAWPHLKNSVSGSISLGLNVNASVKVAGINVGAQLNAGSIQMGEESFKATTGVGVNVGIIGVEAYENAYDLDSSHSIKEEGIKVNVPFWSEDYRTITTFDSTNRTYQEVKREKYVDTEMGEINVSVGLGVGASVTINIQEFWQFIVDLFE